ncbi:hypothetical protein FJT64_005932 [Amphibalanus amphitrite]|uniref:Uncharacterized protein n=1 Tax=Amphibalanus amphitrite TaxID=1232801 RepID=A0A6A4W452_AMPAM|nr:hypothetical protein FJT64_005932 [Amphibalanus amphitrite]
MRPNPTSTTCPTEFNNDLKFKVNAAGEKFPCRSQAFQTGLDSRLTCLTCIRDELMVATASGHVLRYRWDGTINYDYCLDLRRTPFSVNQQVSVGRSGMV